MKNWQNRKNVYFHTKSWLWYPIILTSLGGENNLFLEGSEDGCVVGAGKSYLSGRKETKMKILPSNVWSSKLHSVLPIHIQCGTFLLHIYLDNTGRTLEGFLPSGSLTLKYVHISSFKTIIKQKIMNLTKNLFSSIEVHTHTFQGWR